MHCLINPLVIKSMSLYWNLLLRHGSSCAQFVDCWVISTLSNYLYALIHLLFCCSLTIITMYFRIAKKTQKFQTPVTRFSDSFRLPDSKIIQFVATKIVLDLLLLNNNTQEISRDLDCLFWQKDILKQPLKPSLKNWLKISKVMVVKKAQNYLMKSNLYLQGYLHNLPYATELLSTLADSLSVFCNFFIIAQ